MLHELSPFRIYRVRMKNVYVPIEFQYKWTRLYFAYMVQLFSDPGSSTTSLIILNQLNDKVKAHDCMINFFLKKVGLWNKVSLLILHLWKSIYF